MRRAALSTCLATMLLAALPLSSPQASPFPPRQAPGTTAQPGDARGNRAPAGVIRGSVTSAQTSVPLRRALVVLTSRSGESRATSTDMQGRYEFTELPAQSYTVKASKAGFATFEYGQRRAREAGRIIDLRDGQLLDKLDIALPRGGAISGRVFDETGDPIEHVRVAAMRSVYRDGRRDLVAVGSPVRTNDLGQYRIHGLPPGTYCVGTPPPVADSVPRVLFGRAFAPTFYPGTSVPADAQPIALDAGQERRDVNLALVASRPVRISGAVTDARGRPAAESLLLLTQPGFVSGATTASADGSFAFENRAPGDYTLSVVGEDRQTGTQQGAGLAITVGAEDLDDIRITLLPARRVTGRIRFDPPATPSFSPKDVQVRPDTSKYAVDSSTRIASDWTFEIANVLSGPTRFRVSGLPDGWALRAVVYGGRDVTDTPIDIRRDLAGLDIVLTNQLTEISGSVTDADTRRTADYTVIAFAEDAARWASERHVATARPDQTGRFSVRGLPAGKYYLVAVDDIAGDDPRDPEYLERLRSSAVKVTLRDGETQVVELRLTREGTRE